MAVYHVPIPAQPPTLNALTRGKLKSRMRLGKMWAQVVAAYVNRAGVPKAKGKRKVSIHIILGYRQVGADPDCWFKSCNDALSSCGALTKDNRFGVELGPVTYGKGKEPACVLTLEDV
jgi:hypothetical protein